MLPPMTLAEWVAKFWQRGDEPVTRSLERLAAEWELTYKTLFYAHRGARCAPHTAQLIEEKTGGKVRAADLVMAPTRAELRAQAEGA